MKLITLQGSKGYNKLSHLPFNRDFKVRQDLIISMNSVGFTMPINLIKTDLFDGKEQLYIADGQHRAITASFLNINFYGIVIDIKFKTIAEIVLYVARLNSGQKPWKCLDYTQSYNYLGYKEYNKLLKVFNNVPYSIETTAAILGGFRCSGSIKTKVVSGDYIAHNYKLGLEVFKLSATLSKYYKPTSRMVLAIAYVYSLKTFNQNKFIRNYASKVEQIVELSLDDYTDIFSDWIK